MFEAKLRGFRKSVDQLILLPSKAAGSTGAYLLAVLIVAVAFFLRLLLGFLDPDASPFTTLYPAILFAALWGGVRAGIFAVVFGGTLAWWAFFDPRFTFVPPLTFGKQLSLVIYLIAALMIVAGADYCRRLAKSLKDEEELRNLTVKELDHRLKNKVATIQAIIALQLRGNATVRDAIFQRLGALSSADTLIEAANGKGAILRDVIGAELGPYHTSNVSVAGPAVLLPPKLALVLALLFHELATNAAKYGALSVPSGRVLISWTLVEGRLKLEWRELGGPAVKTPKHNGFGSQLLSRALKQFDGSVELIFDPAGLNCNMSLAIHGQGSSRDPRAIQKTNQVLLAGLNVIEGQRQDFVALS